MPIDKKSETKKRALEVKNQLENQFSKFDFSITSVEESTATISATLPSGFTSVSVNIYGEKISAQVEPVDFKSGVAVSEAREESPTEEFQNACDRAERAYQDELDILDRSD